MLRETKNKLEKILINNINYPLIIEGINSASIANPILIPAIIPSSELGIISTESGLKYPTWLMEVMIKSKGSDRVIICIDGLDRITKEEQEKFYGILKYKGINGYKFPNNTQIIIPIKKSNNNNINPRIKSLCLKYEVE